MRAAALLLLGALAGALGYGCGARSALLTADGEGGDGGGSSSASLSASSSSTTGGGGAGPCQLIQREVRSFDSKLGYRGHTPRLVASDSSGQLVSLMHRAAPEPVPIDSSPELLQLTFSPWGQWSAASLGTDIDLATVNDFTAPRTLDAGLSYWASFSTFASGPGMLYALSVSTAQSYPPATIALQPTVIPGFITGPVAGLHALGYIDPSSGPNFGHLALVSNGSFDDFAYACTTTPMRMDGIRRRRRLPHCANPCRYGRMRECGRRRRCQNG